MKKFIIAVILGLFLVGYVSSIVGCGPKQVDPNTERGLGNDDSDDEE